METLDQKDSAQISDESVNILGASQGWVIAAGILMAICALFTLIGSLGMFAFMPLVGLMYLVMAGALGYLSSLVIIQGVNAGKFKNSKSPDDFHNFAVAYKNYWTWTIIVSIIIFVLAIIVTVAAANMRSSMMYNRYNYY